MSRTAVFCAAVAVSIHVATAVARLGTLVPSPAMPDFAGVYTAAWTLRHGTYMPAKWPPAMLQTLRAERGLTGEPTPVLSLPVWVWLLQPLTAYSFPTAAWIWLLVLVGLTGWSARRIAQLTQLHEWRARIAVGLLVVTFGPVVLSVTLGQNSLVLLCAALAAGAALRTDNGRRRIQALVLWVLAVAAKLVPAAWLVVLPLTRRGRLLAPFLAAGLAMALLAVTVTPASTQSYVRQMPAITTKFFHEKLGLDDQSLGAWIQRLGRPQRFAVHGLFLEQHKVSWTLPWSFEPTHLRAGGIVVIAALGLALVVALRRTAAQEPEGALYAVVLYTLLAVPHMERYDYVLLLPAMAWLWPRGSHARTLVLCSYCLAALSRLNHLWAAFLPGLLAALASGFGTCAALVLSYGVLRALATPKMPPATAAPGRPGMASSAQTVE